MLRAAAAAEWLQSRIDGSICVATAGASSKINSPTTDGRVIRRCSSSTPAPRSALRPLRLEAAGCAAERLDWTR